MPEVGSWAGDVGSAGRAAACSIGALLCATAVLGADGPEGSVGGCVCGRGEGSAPLCWGCRVGGAAGVGAVGREWGDQCLKAGEQWVRAVAVLYG